MNGKPTIAETFRLVQKIEDDVTSLHEKIDILTTIIATHQEKLKYHEEEFKKHDVRLNDAAAKAWGLIALFLSGVIAKLLNLI